MAVVRYKSLKLTRQARGGQILLRYPKWADFDQWAALRTGNKTYLRPWEPQWDEAHLTRRAYRARLTAYERMAQSGTGFPFHIFLDDSQTLIGACHITQIRRAPAQSAELGYWVGQEFSRRGFARAAVKSVLQFSFENLGLHRVQAAVQADNERSIKLLHACGFTLEGRARSYLKIDGAWRDHDIYACLSSD